MGSSRSLIWHVYSQSSLTHSDVPRALRRGGRQPIPPLTTARAPAENPGSRVKGSTEKPDSFIKETYTEGYVSAYVFRIKGFNLVNESRVCSFQYVEV